MPQRLEIHQSAQSLCYWLDGQRNGARFLPMIGIVFFKHPERNVKMITHFDLTPTLRKSGFNSVPPPYVLENGTSLSMRQLPFHNYNPDT